MFAPLRLTVPYKLQPLIQKWPYSTVPFGLVKLGYKAKNILFALEYLYWQAKKGKGSLKLLAEFGVASGEGLRQMYILAELFCLYHNIGMSTIVGFDSFEELHHTDNPADQGEWSVGDYKGDYDRLISFIEFAGWSCNCKIIKGYFEYSIPADPSFSPDLILVDCDYYTSTVDIFKALKERVRSGAIVYFDDLGSNFYNNNLGEEKFIHEVNKGVYGHAYNLHRISSHCYIWSNSDKPVLKSDQTGTLSIGLKHSTKLGNFY